MNSIGDNLEFFMNKVTPSNKQKCSEISNWINKQVVLDDVSVRNAKRKSEHERKYHPVRPLRGEIFMAEMGSNVGVEFKDYHPVLILQNDRGTFMVRHR